MGKLTTLGKLARSGCHRSTEHKRDQIPSVGLCEIHGNGYISGLTIGPVSSERLFTSPKLNTLFLGCELFVENLPPRQAQFFSQDGFVGTAQRCG